MNKGLVLEYKIKGLKFNYVNMEERIINRLCVIIFANAAFTLIGCYIVYLFLKDIENTLHEKIQNLSDTLEQMQWEKDLKEATEMLFRKSKNDTIIHI